MSSTTINTSSSSAPAALETQSKSDAAPRRPNFNSQITSDRLREGSTMRQPPFRLGGSIRKGRKSIFKEIGLDDDFVRETSVAAIVSSNSDESRILIENEKSFGHVTGLRSDILSVENEYTDKADSEAHPAASDRSTHRRQNSLPLKPWFSRITNSKGRPRVKSASEAPPGTASGLQRFTLIALLIAVVLPAFSYRKDNTVVGINGADAGVIRPREKSPIDVCTRWAQQVAFLNGTLYIYGGQAQETQGQEQNTWNNNFLTLDLTEDWGIDSPSFTGLMIPEGPPAVAMGYLWHDYDNLYLYGGEFSSKPYVEVAPESVWKYSVSDATWTEFKNPQASHGNYSEPAGQQVHRAAEGAGISVPELGLSWYFGGHLDWATVPGWSRNTDRVYLKSLLEFTHPGYVNSGVDQLSTGTGAGKQGAYRNITQGGVQANEFPERADGELVFVPGWGPSGVLIGLAGGTWDSFTHDLGTLDVYDIASSEWFHQKTSGDIPDVRVNPCAVIASAPDASSFQIYMFGGQNLQPQGDQSQYDDMYILTIPSFTWIKVDYSSSNAPSGRSGHTCTLQDAQMVLVGGYTGKNAGCDSPGVYVFDASSLQWVDKFHALDHPADVDTDNSVLAGSHGYTVPDAVQSVIGGGAEGGATASSPVESATGGPFATGKPPVFTVTQSGSTATITQWGPKATGSGSNSDQGSSSGGGGDDDADDSSPPRAGLIAAGVVAGIAGALACYLGFCAWLYRRQVRRYRHHLAVTNRYSGASGGSLDAATAALVGRRSDYYGPASRCSSEMEEEAGRGWLGRPEREPAWLSDSRWASWDDPSAAGTLATQGSNSGGSGSGTKHSEETKAPPETRDSSDSSDGLLDGQEPSFFSVVMGPRRALKVVNGAE